MLKLKKIPVKKTDYPKEVISESLPYYNPSVSFNDKQIKEIGDWQVGEKYQVVVELVMTRKEEYKDGNVSGGFDITAYKVLGDALSDDDIEELQAIGLSS